MQYSSTIKPRKGESIFYKKIVFYFNYRSFMKMKKQLLQRDKMIKCDKKKLPFRKINSYHKLHKFRYFFKSQYKNYLGTTNLVYVMIKSKIFHS